MGAMVRLQSNRTRGGWFLPAFLYLSLTAFAAPAPYGVSINPDKPVSRVESTFVPLNANLSRLRQPDGKVRLFYRNLESPKRFYGEQYPWEGLVVGNITKIRTARAFGHGHTTFDVVGGRVVQISANGKSFPVPPPKVVVTNSVESYWPKVTLFEKFKDGTYWKSSGRLQVFYGNPNLTGALFAELCLLPFLFIRRRTWVVVLGLLWSVACLALVLWSGSRGALVGLMAAVGICGLFALRGFSVRTRLLVLASGLALVVASGVALNYVRKGNTFEVSDWGTKGRLTLMSKVPAMVYTAPSGWGAGKSGLSLADWFQDQNDPAFVGSLVSGHLTSFVEIGNVMRVLYLLLWLGLPAWLFVQVVRRRVSPWPLAIWLAFCITALFNPTNFARTLWLIPVFSLFPALRGLSRRDISPALRVFGPVAVASVGAVWAIAQIGARDAARMDCIVRAAPRQVMVNGDNPDVWVVDDGFALDGGYPGMRGKDIRNYYWRNRKAPPLGLVDSLDDLPDRKLVRLVLIGKQGKEFLRRYREGICGDLPKSVFFISPPFGSSEIPDRLREDCNVVFLAGEFLARATGDLKTRKDWVRIARGCELYVPGWTTEILTIRYGDFDNDKI